MKTAAAFGLGFAAGMGCLAMVLWSAGSLVPRRVQAAPKVPGAIQSPEGLQYKDPQFDNGEPKQSPAAAPPLQLPDTPPNPSTAAAPPVPAVLNAAVLLGMPVAGVNRHTLRSNFSETRGGHAHEALDIMAPAERVVHLAGDIYEYR
jgi:hypothetical protein